MHTTKFSHSLKKVSSVFPKTYFVKLDPDCEFKTFLCDDRDILQFLIGKEREEHNEENGVFQITHTCQFEHVFRLIRNNPGVDELKLINITKYDGPEENLYFVKLEFDAFRVNDYDRIKRHFMDFSNLDPENIVFS